MRGSAQALVEYQTSPEISERLKAVLELNVNASFAPEFVGYYTNQWTPVNTFAYSGNTVTGASFVTKTVTVPKSIVEGTEDSQIVYLRYEDEEDSKYSGMFPIESITYTDRPQPGVAKLVASTSPYQVPGSHVRFYLPGRNDLNKYWRSWSSITTVDPSDGNPTSKAVDNRAGYNMGPFVVWKKDSNQQGIWVNKIRIAVQNYFCLPTSYKVEVLKEGSQTWQTAWSNTDSGAAGSNPWPLDGILKIYYNNNAWTSTPNLDSLESLVNGGPITDAVKIRGVRLSVTKARKFNASRSALDYTTTLTTFPLEVIELSPRMVIDISDSVMDFDMVQNISESDSPLPVGSISANDAMVSLENYGSLFDTSNPSSLLYGYKLDKSVLDIYITSVGETNRVMYGFVESADSTGDSTIKFSALDGMSRLQKMDIKGFVAINERLSTIVRRLLDMTTGDAMSLTFLNGPTLEDPYIPYFYVESDTVYNALADLAEAHQFAMYYDSDNVLNLFSKEYLVDSSTYSMTLSTEDISGTLANIKSIYTEPGKPVNDIEVRWSPHYIPVEVPEYDQGKPMWEAQREDAREVAWESEDGVIGAAPLVKTCAAVETNWICIDQEGGEYFDYDGYIMVDNEIIAYRGKEFKYLDTTTQKYESIVVYDREGYLDLLSRAVNGSRIYFTGNLKIQKRGAFGTATQPHVVDTASEYPYANTTFGYFESWKICSYRIAGSSTATNKRGAPTWKFVGGTAYNLRGNVDVFGVPVRNGSESAVRMVGPKPSDFTGYTETRDRVDAACVNSAHAYVAWTPYKTGSATQRILPGRVSAGLRILGKVDSKGNTIGPYGLHGSAGVMMALTGSAGVLSGWAADISLVTANDIPNVRLYKLTNSQWSQRAIGTYVVAPHLFTLNNYTSGTSNFYDVDISYWPRMDGINDGIKVQINGKVVIAYVLPAGETFNNSYAYGMYVRGNTYADFDYIYWSLNANESQVDGWSDSASTNTNEINIYSAISGGVTGPVSWWETDTALMTSSYKSSADKFGLWEFGPIGHEVRVMRPTWDSPYLNTDIIRPLNSAAEYKIPTYSTNPWGAELVVVNAQRHAVVLGSNGSLLGVTGTPINKESASYTLDQFLRDNPGETLVNAKILASRKIYGKIPMTIDSDWIQTKAQASSLIKFIAENASVDCDLIDLSIFGNPLLEPGDIVRIYAPEVNYVDLNRRYLITEKSDEWDNGLATNLKARRVA